MPDDLPSAVLDTNTVLDWLVFRDPAALALAGEIEAGRLAWVASPAMRQEFDQVLPRAALARWAPDATAAATMWERHARLQPTEPPTGPLNCRDPDDQVFIDLALEARCTWLVTRDRALLVLARRAAVWGLTILEPRRWLTSQPMPAFSDSLPPAP